MNMDYATTLIAFGHSRFTRINGVDEASRPRLIVRCEPHYTAFCGTKEVHYLGEVAAPCDFVLDVCDGSLCASLPLLCQHVRRVERMTGCGLGRYRLRRLCDV